MDIAFGFADSPEAELLAAELKERLQRVMAAL